MKRPQEVPLHICNIYDQKEECPQACIFQSLVHQSFVRWAHELLSVLVLPFPDELVRQCNTKLLLEQPVKKVTLSSSRGVVFWSSYFLNVVNTVAVKLQVAGRETRWAMLFRPFDADAGVARRTGRLERRTADRARSCDRRGCIFSYSFSLFPRRKSTHTTHSKIAASVVFCNYKLLTVVAFQNHCAISSPIRWEKKMTLTR